MGKTFIGIDPGLDGGIAIIEDMLSTTRNVRLLPVPILVHKKKKQYHYWKILAEFKAQNLGRHGYREQDGIVLIEETPFIPISKDGGNKFSIKSIQSLANFIGVVKGICIALNIAFDTVNAKTWQKELFPNKSGDTKLLAIEYCQSMYPDVSLLSSERAKKPHKGMADALCIADYARRVYV